MQLKSQKMKLIKILGIDPGSHRLGYGLIAKKINGEIALLDRGLINIKVPSPEKRICLLDKKIRNLINKTKPDLIGVEKLYFSRNQKTAMMVAEARGIVLLAASQYRVPVKEFGPTTVKQRIAGNGRADKKAILKMVKLFLKIKNLNCADDVSDAIAIALTAAFD